ncbi:hypothetical protein K437DRAFT_265289 [Tilletiaria anomala UBC 951]|uniref:Uncharacterized protein n=1 Tax=Tilletiaria anomala (strain ATCC 24038 / CBS 436.72 / UBC 951) TaxID=1037660 RepID=A0A066VD28_TILAU|nr:uncharacterized protein K437DRAFT_265289 [Tilletiaria anomala UBC 951]KDN36485.1 hypothetical protein K437DRAFT_265289 [Tilletiaria anomala UBC 951]
MNQSQSTLTMLLRVGLKRRASSDNSVIAPAPDQRAQNIRASNSTGHLVESNRIPSNGGNMTAGGIYSRPSQHPELLLTIKFELDELIDAVGANRQSPPASHQARNGNDNPEAPHFGLPVQRHLAILLFSSGASISSHPSRLASVPLGHASFSESRDSEDRSAYGSSAAIDRQGAAGGWCALGKLDLDKGAVERVVGLLDRRYANEAVAASTAAAAGAHQHVHSHPSGSRRRSRCSASLLRRKPHRRRL